MIKIYCMMKERRKMKDERIMINIYCMLVIRFMMG
jgi:hypothetical protein